MSNVSLNKESFKVCLEIQTLVSEPTGLHRYTSNLYKNYRAIFPDDELSGICFRRENIEPLDRSTLDQIITSDLTKKRRITKKWLFKRAGDLVDIKPSKHQARYEDLRKEVMLGEINKLTSKELTKLKRRREMVRQMMKFEFLLQYLKYGPTTQVFYDSQTNIVHSPYNAFPDSYEVDNTKIFRVQTVHDLVPLKFPELFSPVALKDFNRILSSALSCDLVLVPSEATKRDLLECGGFVESDIVVTPLAADDVFTPATDPEIKICREKIGIPDDKEYFLSVSSLEPRKNFPFLLKAFKELLDRRVGNSPILVLTGKAGRDGATQQEIALLLKELKDNVIYTGFITDNDLRALYSGARAFLMPSIYEGFGLPILEALACGTPVISSNTSSMPEVVGDSGILISPYNSEQWVASMMTLLELNAQEYSDLCKRSYERSLHFSWKATARITGASFRNLKSQTLVEHCNGKMDPLEYNFNL
jgi:glycosyltransferase involved in cell wall biosynthesis